MDKYFIKTDKLSAEAMFSNGKFVILKGSKARKDVAPSFPKAQIQMREELIELGVLVDAGSCLIFSKNHLCKSPSEASNLIIGTSSNGPKCWKDSSGITLKSRMRSDD